MRVFSFVFFVLLEVMISDDVQTHTSTGLFIIIHFFKFYLWTVNLLKLTVLTIYRSIPLLSFSMLCIPYSQQAISSPCTPPLQILPKQPKTPPL